MDKIRENIATLFAHDEDKGHRLDILEEFKDWELKLLIGTIFTIIGGVILYFLTTKKVL